MRILEVERNAPCICGSGLKYKRCCLFTMEKLQRHWDREKYFWLSPELAFALAMVCGLPREEGEIIPTLAEIEEALDDITERVYEAEDEQKGMECLFDMFAEFQELVKNDVALEHLFFPAEYVAEFLDITEDKIESLGYEPEEEDVQEIFDDCLEQFLKMVVDKELQEALTLDLVSVMRKRTYDLEERVALINALISSLMESGDSIVWEAIFRASVWDFFNSDEDEEDIDEKEEMLIPDPAWPVVKSFIPEQECWNIGGIGTAGVIQELPEGGFCLTCFVLLLPLRKIGAAWSAEFPTIEEVMTFMEDNWLAIPPWQEGTLELASRYIWGMYAVADKEGWDLENVEEYLPVIPKPEGEQSRWLQDLLVDGGLTSIRLAELIDELGDPQDLPEGKDYFVWTTVNYRVNDALSVVEKLADNPVFAVEEKVPGQEWNIVLLGDYVKERESQLNNKDNERPRYFVANIGIRGRLLQVEVKNLSVTVQTIQILKHILGEQLTFESVEWTTPQDMLQKIEKEAKAAGKKNSRKNKGQEELLF